MVVDISFPHAENRGIAASVIGLLSEFYDHGKAAQRPARDSQFKPNSIYEIQRFTCSYRGPWPHDSSIGSPERILRHFRHLEPIRLGHVWNISIRGHFPRRVFLFH